MKIVTAGYFSDDDENVHVLSGEDTKSFNKMIVTILVSKTSFYIT